MKSCSFTLPLLLPALAIASGCTEDVGNSGGGGSGAVPASPSSSASGQGGEGGVDLSDEGTPIVVPVPEAGRVYVDLDTPTVLELTDEQAAASTEWELAFEGLDVFTNSGASGPGTGGAFGPYDGFVFLSDVEPEAPFLLEDRTGGAFLRWYAYEGAIHALWSRHHVYGIKDPDGAAYKLQILSYYGEIQGAPVTAIYRVRWAAVTDQGVGPTQTIDDLDGTAGGLAGNENDPSGCLDLATGTVRPYTVAEAQVATDWHLCFRRDAITVNGGLGGPGEVTAVDITRTYAPEELELDAYKAMTPASQLGPFDDVDLAALDASALTYRGDRVVSAFDTAWVDTSVSPPSPTQTTWLVQRGDAGQRFLLYAESFVGATDTNAGTIHLRVKTVSAP